MTKSIILLILPEVIIHQYHDYNNQGTIYVAAAYLRHCKLNAKSCLNKKLKLSCCWVLSGRYFDIVVHISKKMIQMSEVLKVHSAYLGKGLLFLLDPTLGVDLTALPVWSLKWEKIMSSSLLHCRKIWRAFMRELLIRANNTLSCKERPQQSSNDLVIFHH